MPAHHQDWCRVLDVQAALWRGGHDRAIGFPHLLIAAVAERDRMTMLHYGSDYDLMAEVTGRPAQWVMPRGAGPSPRPSTVRN